MGNLTGTFLGTIMAVHGDVPMEDNDFLITLPSGEYASFAQEEIDFSGLNTPEEIVVPLNEGIQGAVDGVTNALDGLADTLAQIPGVIEQEVMGDRLPKARGLVVDTLQSEGYETFEAADLNGDGVVKATIIPERGVNPFEEQETPAFADDVKFDCAGDVVRKMAMGKISQQDAKGQIAACTAAPSAPDNASPNVLHTTVTLDGGGALKP